MIQLKNNILKNVISGNVVIIVGMVISLLMLPFTMSYLSKPEFGIFAILSDTLGWLSIANLGVTSVFSSRAAHLLSRGDAKNLNRVISTTFFTHLGSTVIILFFGVFFYFNPNFLFGDEYKNENLDIVILFLLLGFLIQYITQPLNSLIVADKKIFLDNYFKLILLLTQTTLTILFLSFGFKLFSLAFSSFISNLLVSILTWTKVFAGMPNLRIDLKHFDFAEMRILLKNGIWLTVGGVAGILIFRMDTTLISRYISLGAVATFVVNNRLYQIAEKFHNQIFNSTRPYFAQIYGKGDIKNLAKAHNLTYYASTITAFVAGAIIFMFGELFLRVWIGAEYYLGDTLNLLLFVNFVVQSMVLPNRIILVSALFKVRQQNISRMIEGLFKLAASLVLLPSVGIIAIPLVSICSSLFFSNILLNYLTSQLLQESFFTKLALLAPVLLLLILYNCNISEVQLIVVIFCLFSLIFLVPKKIRAWSNLKFVRNRILQRGQLN